MQISKTFKQPYRKNCMIQKYKYSELPSISYVRRYPTWTRVHSVTYK